MLTFGPELLMVAYHYQALCTLAETLMWEKGYVRGQHFVVSPFFCEKKIQKKIQLT
jgi:hypothetical protein